MTASTVQIILLSAMVGLVAHFVASRHKARTRAGMKSGLVVFVIACLQAIVHLDDLAMVANWIGMARGTDLLLYVLVLAFVLITASFYIHFREQELCYARLARAVVLRTVVRLEEEIVISGSQNNNRKGSPTNIEKNAPSD